MKTLLIVLAVIILIIAAVIFLKSASRVVLSIDTISKIETGQEFQAHIMINTNDKEISGVDILMEYDEQAIQVIHAIDATESVFPIWPMRTAENGKISMSALVVPGQTFSGQGKIATLWLKALKPGKTSISFVFEKDSTEDTNAAFNGKDLLDKVINAKFNIK